MSKTDARIAHFREVLRTVAADVEGVAPFTARGLRAIAAQIEGAILPGGHKGRGGHLTLDGLVSKIAAELTAEGAGPVALRLLAAYGLADIGAPDWRPAETLPEDLI